MTQRESGPSGILLLDKPAGITSHDLVARTRRALGTRKVGHAGTLDPMATGVMVLGAGAATRLLTYIVGDDKEYLATIRLGVETNTEDAEGVVTAVAEPAAVDAVAGDPDRIARVMAALTGGIDQVPSAVSAIKVNGVRAYKRVRDGEDVELPARRVTIAEFELVGRGEAHDADLPATSAGATATTAADAEAGVGADPAAFAPVPVSALPASARVLDLDVRVACSSGTYVRALARDLGRALGTGAHLTALRRTRVGVLRIADAVSVDAPDLAQRLVSVEDAACARFPVLDLDAQRAVDLGHGKTIEIEPGNVRGDAAAAPGAPWAAMSPEGRLIGLVTVRGRRARSVLNMPQEQRPPKGADAGTTGSPSSASRPSSGGEDGGATA